MKQNYPSLTLLVSLFLILSGCVPGRIDHVYTDSRYQQWMSHIPYSRALGVQVSGNAFDMNQEEFVTLVNEAVQAPGFEPNPSANPLIHMVFGNGTGLSFQEACAARGSDASKGKKGSDVDVIAILCQGNETLTYLVAHVSEIDGPRDPQFRKFLRYITVRLFPQQTNETRDNYCVVPGC